MNHTPWIPAALLAVATMAFAGTTVAQTQAAPAAAVRSASPTTAAKPAASALRAEPVPAQVDAAFKAFDTDHNGSLSLAEFRTGWQALRRGGAQTGQARLQQQFKQLDTDKDGGIDRDEYPNMMLVKRAGGSAPPFAEFDSDRSQKLEFAEYASLVQRLSARQTGSAPPTK
ncbi:EF hand domain-containing protein [Luteimonas cucumeris]|uniref:EF hand domain-containing protein n=1 Tax=Luteimonas cucumeris TaxID=985012 RepID=A0A562L2K1_9GAMM|nr:EF-hand domain-containing protein [Luteimonas cucumeris]TWI01694.1 EF hand domain-containing protein [Luteimonas cucumeris]